MSDQFTEVTSQSWFSRIGSSIKGILFGLILFIAGFPVLWLNEGRAVKTARTLAEGAAMVVPVNSDSVDSANDGTLVHTSGTATTEEMLTDADFGVSANAIKLARTVEMYQWQEDKKSNTQKKLGGGTETTTTYSYKQVWSAKPISSSGFKKSAEHQNPPEMPFTSKALAAEKVTLGGFRMSDALVDQIEPGEALAAESADGVSESLKGKAKVSQGRFYIGENEATPKVGDLRVSFRIAPPQEVSVVAKQADGVLEPYIAKAGGTICLLEKGKVSADLMFEAAVKRNIMMTWLLRGLGFLLMAVGISMILAPLSVLADVVPFIGNIVEFGTKLIAGIVAAGFSLVTIAIAWVFYRPILGIALLVVAAGITVGTVVLVRNRNAGEAAAE